MSSLLHVVTSSTNDYAHEHPELPHGTVVVSPYQAGGKGRNGRSFVSKEGGAYFSVIRTDDWAIADCCKYMMASPLAVVDTLKELGVNAMVKYPNDVLVGGAKICGILIETTWKEAKISRAILGIGINVNNDLTGIDVRATSLQKELGHQVDVDRLMLRVVDRLDRWLALSKEEIAGALRRDLVTLGRKVKTDKGEGIAVALRDDGSLVVDDNGKQWIVGVGDVVIMEEIC